jgi:hypothetical protein
MSFWRWRPAIGALATAQDPWSFQPYCLGTTNALRKAMDKLQSQPKERHPMTKTAKAYIATVIMTGAAATVFALAQWRSDDPTRFAVFLTLFLAAATLKCCVPGVAGTYSPVFFFALLGSTTLSLPEVWVASALAGMVQTIYKPKYQPSLIRLCFNGANMALAATAAYVFVQRMIPGLAEQPALLCLILGAAAFYVVNTGLVSVVMALTEDGSLAAIWKNWCAGCLPYYVVGVLLTDATDPVAQVLAAVIVPSILLATYYYRSRDEMGVAGATV